MILNFSVGTIKYHHKDEHISYCTVRPIQAFVSLPVPHLVPFRSNHHQVKRCEFQVIVIVYL